MEPAPTQLVDDTIINVAQLLKEHVGSKRRVELTLAELQLDDRVMARDVTAQIKLTRISDGVLATGTIAGLATLECVRCLSEFDTEFQGEIEAQFQPTVDIASGIELGAGADDEVFEIDEGHQLDFSELLRQVTLLSLPIRPVCGDDCPGFQREFRGDDEAPAEDAGDERLSVLAQLLEDSKERS
jgi:uncharacterized protein